MPRISVRVQPGARRNEITGLVEGVWRIRLAAPPIEGRANTALVEFLSDCLDIRKSSVQIRSGHSSRQKIVEILGLTEADIGRRLAKAAEAKH